MADLEKLAQCIQTGNAAEAVALTNDALAAGIAPFEILQTGLIAPMDIVGEKFSRNEVFIPEMLIAARAMAMCTDVLKPALAEDGVEPLGKAVIGTVKGDMHDIGKNLVRMLLEAKGFEVEDLGVDVDAQKFVDFVAANPDCKIVCLSALLTTTMANMAATVKAIRDAGLSDQVKIFVGGAPITQEFADEIGADYYTMDAGTCAAKAAEVARA